MASVDHAPQPTAQASPQTAPKVLPSPRTFAEVIELFENKKFGMIATLLGHNVRLVRFDQGLIEFNPDKNVPKDVPNQISKCLRKWTGQSWLVSMVNAAGQPTLHEQELEHAKADPLVKSILDAFPGATIAGVRRADDDK